MAHVRKADRRGAAGPRIVPIALASSGAALVALAIVWQHAQNYDTTQSARGAALAGQALRSHGLTWARVTERDGIVNIAGAAPSEAARVIAYHATRRALRPLMGRDAAITDIRSLVVLRAKPEPLGRSAVTPPLDIASLPPPPLPLVHEPVKHAAIDAPAATQSAHDEHAHESAGATGTIETGAVTRTQESTPAEGGSADQPTETADAAPSNVTIVTLEAPQAQLEKQHQEDSVAALDTTSATASSAVEPEPQQAAPAPVQTSAADADSTPQAGESAPASPTIEPEPQPQAATAPVQTAALDSEPAPQADVCADAFASALDGTTINFARASAVIQKESRPLLDKLAAIAKRCKGYRLTVEGHTDLTGSPRANLTLSKKRAEAVRWALVDRGIDMDHIAAEGFGATRPLESGITAEANARNRRIAITVSEAASRNAKNAAK